MTTPPRDPAVCIIGLGYVGLTLAAVMADVGFEVWGVERRADVVQALKAGEAHFFERGLSAMLRKSAPRLHFETAIPADCPATVFIVTVGTPLTGAGEVNLDAIRDVAGQVAARLKDGDMVILRSTVRLGVTRGIVAETLDRSGKAYDLAFCPERTSEGQALRELHTLPQIVGSPSILARQRAAQMFNMMTPTIVHVESFEGAELIKLIDNSYRDTMFAFANEIARICDAVGLDAHEVIAAGNLGYPRTNVLRPGTVGGPCLEKDPHVLAEGLKPYDITPELIATGRMINERQPLETAAQIRAVVDGLEGFPAAPRIVLLGLAFKGRPETDDLRGTTSLLILRALKAQFPKASWRLYDPVVRAVEAQAFFGEPAEVTVEGACEGADLVVIANNHPFFETLALERIAERMARPSLIYDYWSNFRLRDVELPQGVRYGALGALVHARAARSPS
jgi:nucleotide sugar dehydrogenase